MLYTTLCLLLPKAEFAEESQSFLLTTKGMKTKKKSIMSAIAPDQPCISGPYR